MDRSALADRKREGLVANFSLSKQIPQRPWPFAARVSNYSASDGLALTAKHAPRDGDYIGPMFKCFSPTRVVCLTEEMVETLYLLGEQECIIGVSGYTVRPPQVRREKPRVCASAPASSRRFHNGLVPKLKLWPVRQARRYPSLAPPFQRKPWWLPVRDVNERSPSIVHWMSDLSL
jgi:hypothetical protein